MSAASDLLRQFDVIGARVENRAGRLVLRPGAEPIPPAMLAAAKLAKEEVLAAISGPKPSTPGATEPDHRCKAPADVPIRPSHHDEPVLLRDGRRLWRFWADSIPGILNDDEIRPAVEARWCGCVLVADGQELIVVEPWLSELPDQTRAELAGNAGTIIALLRGESRRRTATSQARAGRSAGTNCQQPGAWLP